MIDRNSEQPHQFSPASLGSGLCFICGLLRERPIHDQANGRTDRADEVMDGSGTHFERDESPSSDDVKVDRMETLQKLAAAPVTSRLEDEATAALRWAVTEITRLRRAVGNAQAHLDRGDNADQRIAKALRSVL